MCEGNLFRWSSHVITFSWASTVTTTSTAVTATEHTLEDLNNWSTIITSYNELAFIALLSVVSISPGLLQLISLYCFSVNLLCFSLLSDATIFIYLSVGFSLLFYS